jgi:nucleoside-diphosphate-sugar epimerase
MSDLMLVTGGAGFIGSHMVSRLLGDGYRVRVLENLSQGRREWVPDAAELIEGTIVDLDACRGACEGVSGVFHMAAMSKVGPSIDKFEFCSEQNVLGTQSVLVAARDAGVAKVVYSASSSSYGNRPAPQREDMAPHALNPYALSKCVGELYCELFTRLYGLPTLSLRYFNVYGPRQPTVGAYALVLGVFLRQKREGRPLTIHGAGEQRRDFVHVRDVVEANLAAYRSPAKGLTLNVGSGTNISVKELADLISPDQVHLPRRAGDAEITLADVTRIEQVLGWRARTPFEDGLRELTEV